jgi:Arc/MetJ family transcription regulator
MRTTLTLDDELLRAAQEYSALKGKPAVVSAALEALIGRKAARRLVRLGGTEPNLTPPPRGRSARDFRP